MDPNEWEKMNKALRPKFKRQNPGRHIIMVWFWIIDLTLGSPPEFKMTLVVYTVKESFSKISTMCFPLLIPKTGPGSKELPGSFIWDHWEFPNSCKQWYRKSMCALCPISLKATSCIIRVQISPPRNEHWLKKKKKNPVGFFGFICAPSLSCVCIVQCSFLTGVRPCQHCQARSIPAPPRDPLATALKPQPPL